MFRKMDISPAALVTSKQGECQYIAFGNRHQTVPSALGLDDFSALLYMILTVLASFLTHFGLIKKWPGEQTHPNFIWC